MTHHDIVFATGTEKHHIRLSCNVNILKCEEWHVKDFTALELLHKALALLVVETEERDEN